MSLDLLDQARSSETLSDWQWSRRDPLSVPGARAQASITSRPVSMRFGPGNFQFAELPANRLLAAIEKICALGDLPIDWDSYGARCIDPFVGQAAVNFLIEVLPAETPLPQIVPTSRGGIQFEWHCNGVDLEIDVRSPSRFLVSFEDIRGGEEQSLTVLGNFRLLLPMLQRLSK